MEILLGDLCGAGVQGSAHRVVEVDLLVVAQRSLRARQDQQAVDQVFGAIDRAAHDVRGLRELGAADVRVLEGDVELRADNRERGA